MKSVILNVRIPIALKEKLESDASANNQSLSDYTRELLSGNQKEIDNYETDDFFFENKATFYNSNEFICLLTWMMEKRIYPYDSNPIGVFEGLRRITLTAIKDYYFTDELKHEFAKVLVDLNRFIGESESVTNNFFRFGLNNYPESFNYNVLLNFIYSKAYENTIFM